MREREGTRQEKDQKISFRNRVMQLTLMSGRKGRINLLLSYDDDDD